MDASLDMMERERANKSMRAWQENQAMAMMTTALDALERLDRTL